jgi:hypothetical protein
VVWHDCRVLVGRAHGTAAQVLTILTFPFRLLVIQPCTMLRHKLH